MSASQIVRDIVLHLNTRTNSSYRSNTPSTVLKLKRLIKNGFTIDDIKLVIDYKSSEWLNNDMYIYLRPDTLFGNKFEGYLQNAIKWKEKNDKLKRIFLEEPDENETVPWLIYRKKNYRRGEKKTEELTLNLRLTFYLRTMDGARVNYTQS